MDVGQVDLYIYDMAHTVRSYKIVSNDDHLAHKELTHPSGPPTLSWNPNLKNLAASSMSSSINCAISSRTLVIRTGVTFVTRTSLLVGVGAGGDD